MKCVLTLKIIIALHRTARKRTQRRRFFAAARSIIILVQVQLSRTLYNVGEGQPSRRTTGGCTGSSGMAGRSIAQTGSTKAHDLVAGGQTNTDKGGEPVEAHARIVVNIVAAVIIVAIVVGVVVELVLARRYGHPEYFEDAGETAATAAAHHIRCSTATESINVCHLGPDHIRLVEHHATGKNTKKNRFNEQKQDRQELSGSVQTRRGSIQGDRRCFGKRGCRYLASAS